MPLTRVGLTTKTSVKNNCTKICIKDITGVYQSVANPLGYGLPSGITYANIQSIVINLYFPNITTPITYNFTMVSGLPTALTVVDLNGNSYNIFSSIGTLYVLGVFDLTGTTAFALPTVSDGIIKTDYTISGTVPEYFSYTTSNSILSTCSTSCCIESLYKNYDASCNCSEDKKETIRNAELFLNAAKKAINIGQDEKAKVLLDEAIKLCDSNCENC